MARRSRVIDSSSESENEAVSEASSPRNELLDLEAVEASSIGSSAGDDDEKDEIDEQFQFHKFREFPPELRRRVWELYCPDLCAPSRILNVCMSWQASHARDFNGHWQFTDDMALADQTERLRMLAAVHKETREICTSLYPDTLRLHAGSGDAEVRYNKDRDVVYFQGLDQAQPLYGAYEDGMCDIVKHVAFPWNPEDVEFPEEMVFFLRSMPNLESVFLCRPHFRMRKHDLRRYASPQLRYSRVETYKKEHGLGEDLEWMYCWPDFEKHWDRMTRRILDSFKEEAPEELSSDLEQKGVKLGPMVSFEFESGVDKFNRLVEEHDIRNGEFEEDSQDESSSEESDNSEAEVEDEYESEGIDDAEIESQDSPSEDELIPNPISADATSEAGNFSPVERRDARFSSPESETVGDDADDNDDEVEIVARRPKRRIVSDSEDEDEEPQAKRARTAPETVDLLSDSDTDSDAGSDGPRIANKRSRRAPIAVSDDESDSDDAEPEYAEEERDGSQQEDSEDEEEQPRTMSLAERLQLHRRENPIRSGDESSDGNGDGSIDDEDEDEDEEEEDSEGGLIDNMAGESEGEGEGESEDGW